MISLVNPQISSEQRRYEIIDLNLTFSDQICAGIYLCKKKKAWHFGLEIMSSSDCLWKLFCKNTFQTNNKDTGSESNFAKRLLQIIDWRKDFIL